MAVLDISADYRLKSAAEYEQWYGVKHTSPQLLDSCVYGLPEENGAALAALQDAQTKLVACAGCYPTASALSALPAAHAGMLAGSRVISDCLSGLSGRAANSPRPHRSAARTRTRTPTAWPRIGTRRR